MIGKIKENYLFYRLKRKEKDAFTEFYDLYADRIYQYIYLKVGQKEAAEDLSSEFFLKIWNCLCDGGVKDYKTFKPFIYTMARNMVIDYYRKTSRQKEVSFQTENEDGEEENGEDLIVDERQDILQEVDDKISREEIEKKLMLLKDEYREVVMLKYMDGLSIGEISKIIGKAPGTVRVTLHRALAKLKELMEKNGQQIIDKTIK